MSLGIPRHRRILAISSATALLLMVGGFFTFHALTAKASGNTLFVGTGGGHNTSCSSPGYHTVQAAVDAATNGQTVFLCGAHSYPGPVVVANKQLNITGDTGATISAPATYTQVAASRLPAIFSTDHLFSPQALVFVWGLHGSANITNLQISGVMATNGGCANEDYGVLALENGTVTLNQDQILDVRDSNPGLYGCQFGVAVQSGRVYWPTSDFSAFTKINSPGHATITTTLVQGYQKNGITIDAPSSTATITGNSVFGAQRGTALAAIIAQNGIQLSRGATATISGNRVTENTYTGSAGFASSGGILIFGGCGDPLVTNVTISNNYLLNNDVGLYINNFSPDPNCVTATSTPTNITVTHNQMLNGEISNVSQETFNGKNYSGYQAGIDDVGNGDTISYNTISGRGYVAHTAVNGPFVEPIDTISVPTFHVHIVGNKIYP